jgi:site-specific recombinase XerD
MKIKGLYQKRGWYYYRAAQKSGVRPPAVALGTKDEEEAIAKVYKLHTEGGLERNVIGSKVKMLTVLEEWLVDARAEGVHRPKTTATSRSCLTDLAKFWGNPTVGWITRERILQWRSHLVERPGRGGRTISEASVASYHTLRHSFATHLAMKGASMIEVASALGDTLVVTERTYIGHVPGTTSTIATL